MAQACRMIQTSAGIRIRGQVTSRPALPVARRERDGVDADDVPSAAAAAAPATTSPVPTSCPWGRTCAAVAPHAPVAAANVALPRQARREPRLAPRPPLTDVGQCLPALRPILHSLVRSAGCPARKPHRLQAPSLAPGPAQAAAGHRHPSPPQGARSARAAACRRPTAPTGTPHRSALRTADGTPSARPQHQDAGSAGTKHLQ